MNSKFRQTRELFKASITVIMRNRKLLWFPLFTSLFILVIALFFVSAIALPFVLHPTGYHLNQKEHWQALEHYYFPSAFPRNSDDQPHPDLDKRMAVGIVQTGFVPHDTYSGGFILRYSLMLLIYLVSMFLATFFNVAFYSEIMAAFDGRGVSFRRGLRTARSRLPSIVAWSLLAGGIGWLIRLIEERLPFVGRLVMGIIGMAWSVAAVFAIPVIIQTEPTGNPLRILQSSAQTLKRTWGESLIGYVGISAASTLAFFGSLIPLVMGFCVAVLFQSWAVTLIVIMLWILLFGAFCYISDIAGNVFRCALYKYATEGTVPEPFDAELLDAAWKMKK